MQNHSVNAVTLLSYITQWKSCTYIWGSEVYTLCQGPADLAIVFNWMFWNFHAVDPPTITVPPQSITVASGSNAEFTCTAIGEGTLAFTWTTTVPVGVPSSVQTRFNAQDGSETSTLSLTNVGSNHIGVYTCSVSNERGSGGTRQATLTIIGQFWEI